MSTRPLRTEDERALALKWLQSFDLPCTMSLTKGAPRSLDQNRLQFQLIRDIADQLEDRTAEEVRAEVKLMIGVPILRAENEAFRETYDRIMKPLPYEQKLEAMGLPLDISVTRLFTTEQFSRYLEAIYRKYGEMGLVLTDPGGM